MIPHQVHALTCSDPDIAVARELIDALSKYLSKEDIKHIFLTLSGVA